MTPARRAVVRAFIAPHLPWCRFRASRSPRRAARCALPSARAMRLAVVGCAHGELDLIYATLSEIDRSQNLTPDLLICAGDFQAVRTPADLHCMAVPPKYRHLRSFWRYYAGLAHAPLPTLFVGGNHEASNHLQEIPLGGLVAPNMYFLGNAGVVNVAGLRIAGLSGVYTHHNYRKSRTERPPYPRSQLKSVYHTRKEDVDRLLRLRGPVDIFVSHDWPKGIVHHGNLDKLLSAKPFLRSEIANDSFGNPAATSLLHKLQPRYWFAAHLHVKFPAIVTHAPAANRTRFLALDKALPKRDFIQILDIDLDPSRAEPTVSFADRSALDRKQPPEFRIDLDPEWLAILRTDAQQPGRDTPVTDEEIQDSVQAVEAKGVKSFVLPMTDFERTGPVHDPKVPNESAPTELSLQECNKRLMEALQLPEEAWIAKVQPQPDEKLVSTEEQGASATAGT